MPRSLSIRRYKKNHLDATLYNLRTAKHFTEFIARGTPGRIEDKATVKSIRVKFRRVTSSWGGEKDIAFPSMSRRRSPM
jgi:hypothetical protein